MGKIGDLIFKHFCMSFPFFPLNSVEPVLRKLNPRGQEIWFQKPYDTSTCTIPRNLGGLSCQYLSLVLVLLICWKYIQILFLPLQSQGSTKNSTAPRRYEGLFHYFFDMGIILMFIIGKCFQAIKNLNKKWRNNTSYSIWKVLDKSISAYLPHTTNAGGLLKISFIERKPEPLGIDFN